MNNKKDNEKELENTTKKDNIEEENNNVPLTLEEENNNVPLTLEEENSILKIKNDDNLKIIENLKEENKILLGKIESWKHKSADIINKAKQEKERNQEIIKFSNKSLLEKLIVILDSYKKSNYIYDNSEKKKLSVETKAIFEGYKLCFQEIFSILKAQKVTLIKIDILKDVFDPRLHFALETVENDNLKEETIVEVLRDGYILDEKVLRQAMVKVSRKSKNKKN